MKIAPSATSQSSQCGPPPPIPFQKKEQDTPKKAECTEFQLYTRPEDPDSQTYNVDIHHFKQGDPGDWLETLDDIEHVLDGSRITTSQGSAAIARAILKGEALQLFEDGVHQHGINTIPGFYQSLQHVTIHLFPTGALMWQKRYMHHTLCKSREITIRNYVVRLREINDKLPRFPPFGDFEAHKLPEDELIDIVEHSIPNSWHKKMMVHVFDPVEHSLQEFCEWLKTTEEMDPHHSSTNDVPKKKKGMRSKVDASCNDEMTHKGVKSSEEAIKKPKKKQAKHNNYEKWCTYHQTSSHNVNDCKVMLAQAQSMQDVWKNQHPEKKYDN